MDEDTYKRTVTRLHKVGAEVKKLPPELRSAAFKLLEEYITAAGADHSIPSKKGAPHPPSKGSAQTMDDFFASSAHDKPSDNVRQIAAFHYREFGTEPFSINEIRKVATDVGITIPQRVDMTLEQAMAKGKKLFARAGTGKFKVTVHGEAYLKSTYGVSKGTKKPVPIKQ